MTAPTATTASPGKQKLRAFLPLLVDLVVPTVVYLILAQLGVPPVWALTLAGVATGVSTAVGTIRRRRLDGVGILVIVEIATSVGLLFLTDDPRLVLLKPSLYTLMAAVFLLITCVVGRPMVYQAATPIATGGDPLRLAAYRQAWVESAQFRFRERMMTAVFGGALLIEAVLRGVIIYALPQGDVAAALTLSQVPGIVLLAGSLLLFKLQVPTLSRIVDGIQERLTPAAQHSTQVAAA
jgi:hypothetical protein